MSPPRPALRWHWRDQFHEAAPFEPSPERGSKRCWAGYLWDRNTALGPRRAKDSPAGRGSIPATGGRFAAGLGGGAVVPPVPALRTPLPRSLSANDGDKEQGRPLRPSEPGRRNSATPGLSGIG